MKEDEITKSIIKYYKDNYGSCESTDIIKIEPEAHYNYYGSRGYVDLFIIIENNINRNSRIEHNIYEIKSHLSNANKVIRQLNKHKEYFYKHEGRSKPFGNSKINWRFQVLASEENYNHMKNYWSMYSSLKDKGWRMQFRHPEAGVTSMYYGNKFRVGEKKWVKYTLKHFSNIASKLKLEKLRN